MREKRWALGVVLVALIIMGLLIGISGVMGADYPGQMRVGGSPMPGAGGATETSSPTAVNPALFGLRFDGQCQNVTVYSAQPVTMAGWAGASGPGLFLSGNAYFDLSNQVMDITLPILPEEGTNPPYQVQVIVTNQYGLNYGVYGFALNGVCAPGG